MKRFVQRGIYGHGLSFYGTFAFLVSFFGSRLFAELNPTVVVVSGTVHFHHFWYGLAMVTATGWLGIAFNHEKLERTYALIFGLGAGLIADEVGLLLTFGDYRSELTTEFFVGAIGFIILATTAVRYRKILERDVIHVSRNERLIHIGIILVGLSTIFFAVNLLAPGLVAAALGIIVLLIAFEAAKAGMVAGLAQGAIIAFGEFLDFQLSGPTRQAIQSAPITDSSLTVDQLVTLTLLIIVLASVLGGVIAGAVLGLIFSAINNRYMKRSSIRARAIIFGLTLWLINSLISLTGQDYGVEYVLASIALGLVGSLVYGYLLGTLFPKFRRKISEEPSSAITALA